MTYGPPTRTVGEVMKAVKRSFGDESEAQLENDDIVAWINDAQDEINNINHILKEQATLTTTLGEDTYSFPAKRIQQIEAVLVDGHLVRNIPYAQALESYIGKSLPMTGIPEVWYEWGGKFTFYPSPPAGEITLLYTVRPTPVQNNVDQKLSIPDKYYQDVVRYVLQQAFIMDEALDLAADQATRFNASINDKGEEERTAQQMTYSTITFLDEY